MDFLRDRLGHCLAVNGSHIEHLTIEIPRKSPGEPERFTAERKETDERGGILYAAWWSYIQGWPALIPVACIQGKLSSINVGEYLLLLRLNSEGIARAPLMKTTGYVKRNRDILERLINAVCFLGKQELAFRGHDETENSVNRGNYVELLKYTAQYDPLLAEHLETSTVFEGISNRIQNDLIQAVGSTVLSAIKQEIIEIPFVAVMVDETSDVANKAQFSIVLRYVHEGEIKERFLGFCDISSDKHAQAIAELIRHLSEFGCNEKLIAQTYEAFFSRSPKRANFLDQFLQRRLPHVCPTGWNYSSRLINTVCRNRIQLCNVFCAMLEHPQEIESDILAPINGFLTLLEDFKFVFLLNTFDKIFTITDVLYNILQNQANDILYCQEKIQETRRSIAALRDDYEEVFQETVSQVGEPPKRKNISYKRIYCEVFDNIDNHLDVRFQDYSKLKFLNLLSPQNYEKYTNQFPESCFQSLIDTYGKFFDIIRLKNELIVVYSSEEFRNKTMSELAKLLSTNSMLKKRFQQFNVLVTLLCTIPVSTSPVERSFSTLKRIKSYSRNSTGEERLSHLGIVSIEARLLGELRKKKEFFDEVVTKFASQERMIEFQFR
ncbi:hypothetical protein ANN_19029 [Periplaneta americana]|uniref:Zinc finger MYM-type protein 1-like n=1 Tax=Periplaneta americana TaxID=6978 RepID=A0ABQ8SRT2_PERAM|nr:hypothetical protein ANN_19029 [Periplaneta americana]